MGKKITVKWQGNKYEARYQVDTVNGEVKDLNGQKVTRGDVQLVIAGLAELGKRDIGAIVRNRYFGN